MNFQLVIPDNIPFYLDGFNRRKYKSIFNEYLENIRPFFAELEQCGDLNAAAGEMVDWIGSRITGLFKTRKFCDVQYFLLSYFSPAALELGSETAAAFAEAVKEAWIAKHPDMRYECTTYEKLSGGFNNAIFGIKINFGGKE